MRGSLRLSRSFYKRLIREERALTNLVIFASFLSLNPNRNRQHGKHIIATKFIPADGWIRAIIPTVTILELHRESRQLNETIYEDTYGTNVRDETHVTDEADGAHESASTLVARKTR